MVQGLLLGRAVLVDWTVDRVGGMAVGQFHRRFCLSDGEDFTGHLIIEFAGPIRKAVVCGVERAQSRVTWSDDDLDVVCADMRCENKEFFDSGIAHREAARRNALAMDENVATEV